MFSESNLNLGYIDFLVKMQKCMICGRRASLERHFSGEKYCVKHAKEKLVIDRLREIVRKSKKVKPDRTYIVMGRYPPEYNFLISIVEKYFSSFTIDIEISDQFHLPNFFSESTEIIREYSNIGKKIEENDTIVILIKTADLIAHDIIFFILENKFEYLEKLKQWDKKIIFPFRNVFLDEICKLFEIHVEPYKHCLIYNFIKKAVKIRPTTVYGIFNYIESLSSLDEK